MNKIIIDLTEIDDTSRNFIDQNYQVCNMLIDAGVPVQQIVNPNPSFPDQILMYKTIDYMEMIEVDTFKREYRW